MVAQRQPKWDIYEAVILLDAWLKTQTGEDKQKEIIRVSKSLRQLAVNRKIKIDDIYRNTNGIALQMLRMRDTFVGENDNGRASKLFMQVVAMYRENQLEYNKYLEEAKIMISETNNISKEYISSKSQILFLSFDKIGDLSNSEPVSLCYRDYVISDLSSWYDLYKKIKSVLGEIVPDILTFDSSIDDNEDSLPDNIIYAIKNIFDFFNLDISELSITYKKTDISYSNNEANNENMNESNVSNDELKDKCITVLKSDFEDGFILGNYMHKMRFVSSFEERYSSDISAEIDDVDIYLSGIGRIVDDRVYAPVETSSSKVLDSIFEDVMTALGKSASCIDVECIFDRYGRELASEMNIYSSETLFSVLKSDRRFTDNCVLNNMSISAFDCEFTLSDEVKKYLKNSAHPITAIELHQIMWYASVEKLKTVLRQLPEAVYVDSSAYFYGPNFYISLEEKAELIKQMNSEIYTKGYISTRNLRKIFRSSCPTASLDSENFKDYGIRELIKYVLSDKFEFKNSLITSIGTTLDLRQVFRDFASEHEKLTLNEIKEFQDEIGLISLNTTYWSAILDETIRISDNELVRKDLIDFDVKSVDEVLDMICPDDYISLKEVDLFLSFPAIQYRWNGFVLESYLRNYSEKFCLFQVSISADAYSGVMVRKDSGFKTYEDVASDMLAKNNTWNDETSALKVLSNTGFQQRAKNRNITAIVKKAKAIRENVNS